MRFHQDNVPAYRTQELQLYFPADYIPSDKDLAEKDLDDLLSGNKYTDTADSDSGNKREYRPKPEPKKQVTAYSAIPFIFLVALGIFLYIRKTKRYAKIVAVAEGIAWAGDDWVAPQIVSGSFAVPGKIAKDLHPVEVAILLSFH